MCNDNDYKDDDNSQDHDDVLRMWVFTPAGPEMSLAGGRRERRGWFTSVWSKVGLLVLFVVIVCYCLPQHGARSDYF